MSYEKQIFEDGRKLVAAQLNHIEEGIAAVEAALEDGVSIESVVQTTTANEDGGTNVITVTLTNGTKSTFRVKNGNKGSDGTIGVSVVSVTIAEVEG